MGLPAIAQGYVYGYALPRMSRTLAANVKALRELKDISQGEANRAAGFNDNRFSTIETGAVKDPQLSTVLGLAVGLGARIDDFVQGLDAGYDAIIAGSVTPQTEPKGGHRDMLLQHPDVAAILGLLAGMKPHIREAALNTLLGIAMEYRKRPPGNEESSARRSLP